jgi:uncharacterized repeat protein (TIGR04076 family)
MVEKASRLKITVLKRFTPQEVDVDFNGGPTAACGVYEDDQVFYVEDNGRMPEGFCSWAWNDIEKVVGVLRWNGNYSWFKEPGVSVNCCTDGLRPVVFKIERV